MVCINSDKFTPSDLCLFIESIEKIGQIEIQKHERLMKYRAQYLAETLRYLDQQYPASSSSTLSSTDEPEEESILENVEEKDILHYAVADIKYHETYAEFKRCSEDTTNLIQNEYCQIENDYGSWNESQCNRHQLASTKISEIYSLCISSIGIYEHVTSMSSYLEPLECIQSTKISKESSRLYEDIAIEATESMTSESFEDSMVEIVKKPSLKRCLLGLVCKKYRNKSLTNNTKSWCKSKSWMKLTAV